MASTDTAFEILWLTRILAVTLLKAPFLKIPFSRKSANEKAYLVLSLPPEIETLWSCDQVGRNVSFCQSTPFTFR